MSERKTVKISSISEELGLESVYLPKNGKTEIVRPDTNRPAFALTGFFDQFEKDRIQVIGNAEHSFLSSLSPSIRKVRIKEFLARSPAAVIFTSNLPIYPEFIEESVRYGVPLLRTSYPTSEFISSLLVYLQVCLAPTDTLHGVLMEIYGEGILIIGDSGIGKSETAIDLVKRGHRLIADDAVEISRVSSKTLVGKSPELIKYYAELRGIGIVDVRRLFGLEAVKNTQKIDIVVYLEEWDPNKFYDRLGLDTEEMEILGLKVPKITIPVTPGRNLSIIIEVAAMNQREKHMGYNTAEEFYKRTIEQAERLERENEN